MSSDATVTERRVLLISAAGCLVIGCVALVAAYASSSQAILLDGLFNLVYFATGLFTLRVARLVQRGDDERFPYGYGFFEPLTNGIKGVLVLGISVVALIDAIVAILGGGRQIEAGIAIGYGAFATAACWTLALATWYGKQRSGSPLVGADAENWLVNGAISSAVLLAFLGIWLIRGTAYEPLTPYIDPALVVIVVLISLAVPIRMAWQALMALLNRTASDEIVRQVTEIVTDSLRELPVRELFVRVIQPGRTRMIAVHVVLPEGFRVEGLSSLDTIRTATLHALRESHPTVVLDMIFTADRRWGAPQGEAELG